MKTAAHEAISPPQTQSKKYVHLKIPHGERLVRNQKDDPLFLKGVDYEGFFLLQDLGFIEVEPAHNIDTWLNFSDDKADDKAGDIKNRLRVTKGLGLMNKALKDFPAPTHPIKCGRVYHIRAFMPVIPQETTHAKRLAFLAKYGAKLTGVQGASLALFLHVDMPIDVPCVSMDVESRLWSDESFDDQDGARRLPCISNDIMARLAFSLTYAHRIAENEAVLAFHLLK